MNKTAIFLSALCFAGLSAADQISDGQSFARQALPSKLTPGSVPAGLGEFSAPLNDSQMLSRAKSVGLLGLGNDAMDSCAAHTFDGTNKARDQECAAVNFMANRCVSPSGSQSAVLGKTGTVQTGGNCAGTFGEGTVKFNYKNTLTENDSLFSGTTEAQKNAGSTMDYSCQSKQVEVAPAQYETQTCSQSTGVDSVSCTQKLDVTVTYGPTNCTQGQWFSGQGRCWGEDCTTVYAVCDFTIPSTDVKIVFHYASSSAWYYVQVPKSGVTATRYYPNSDACYTGCPRSWYSSSPGYVYAGGGCNANGVCTYTVGSNYVTVPITFNAPSKSVVVTPQWNDQCQSLEKNAGITLTP